MSDDVIVLLMYLSWESWRDEMDAVESLNDNDGRMRQMFEQEEICMVSRRE
jgi:hypothetical protein